MLMMQDPSRAPKRVQRYNAEGQKERYFADDDNVDLAVSMLFVLWASKMHEHRLAGA